jgi:hypothetical protein
MKFCLKKRKQLLSFLPVKVSVNDSEKIYLSGNRYIYKETEQNDIKLKYGLFNLNKEIHINSGTSDYTEIECYFNLDITGYITIIGGFIAVLIGLVATFIDNNELPYLIIFISFLFIFIQRLNNSLIARKIQ